VSRQPTVADHLRAFGEPPDWLLSLGEAICQITQCSAAIAASRARDLSRQPGIAQGLESLLRGWKSLDQENLSGLSPMQIETIQLVIGRMLETLHAQVKARQKVDSSQKEMLA
jgi:hypothetical protein